MTKFNLKTLSVPTILVEGQTPELQEYAEKALCNYFCNNIGQCFCVHCRRVVQRQHPSLLWICPEKGYTIDDLDAVFDKVRFALQDQERFFIVIDRAQTLSLAASNRLLKILEEPPAGYVFILLTTNKNDMLPTIISRSYFINLSNTQENVDLHPLSDYFLIKERLLDPFKFEQDLKKYKLSESEAVQLCIDVLAHTAKNKNSFNKVVSLCLKDILKENLPGTGSASFFLKTVFLRISCKVFG